MTNDSIPDIVATFLMKLQKGLFRFHPDWFDIILSEVYAPIVGGINPKDLHKLSNSFQCFLATFLLGLVSINIDVLKCEWS